MQNIVLEISWLNYFKKWLYSLQSWSSDHATLYKQLDLNNIIFKVLNSITF